MMELRRALPHALHRALFEEIVPLMLSCWTAGPPVGRPPRERLPGWDFVQDTLQKQLEQGQRRGESSSKRLDPSLVVWCVSRTKWSELWPGRRGFRDADAAGAGQHAARGAPAGTGSVPQGLRSVLLLIPPSQCGSPAGPDSSALSGSLEPLPILGR
jgi:hypothetical protein